MIRENGNGVEPRHGQVTSLFNYLPAIFQDDRKDGQPNFLGRFLLAFEDILLGLGETPPLETEDPKQPGIEEILASVEQYFEPGATLEDHKRTPKDFLPWLARWVAVTLRDDLDDKRKRELISKAAQLYRLRGTKRGVEEFLNFHTQEAALVDELNTPFQLGAHSRVGKDTILDGGAPFFFIVTIPLPAPDTKKILEQREIATAIVDLQKPAHCHYRLEVATPTFRIGVYSHVGVDMLLGKVATPIFQIGVYSHVGMYSLRG
jgi:phage tail-like protein